MAFPEEKQTFIRAQDPDFSSSTDVTLVNQYQTYLANGEYASAQQVLANWAKGISVNLNAGRFNAVLECVEAITDFLSNDNSKFKTYIQDQITSFSYIDYYDSTFSYRVGNIACDSSSLQWYKCKVANVGQPLSNTTYWEPFLKQQNAKKYPVQATEPTGLQTGDLWFKTTE